MQQPQLYTGQVNKYSILRIRNCYTVYFSNGLKRLVENIFTYASAPPGAGACAPSPFSQGQKAGLVTFTAGVTYGGVTYWGFQATVLSVLNTLLNVGALSAGTFAKWIDQPNDFDMQVGTYAPTLPQTSASVGNGAASGGGIGSIASRMPLDQHVTVRKFTGVAGKEWSRGRWKFAPIDESIVHGDELTAGAEASWNALKAVLYAPITDGTLTGGAGSAPNLMYPVLVSTKLSQLRIFPTQVAYAPLVLPGVNYITGITNQIINATVGEQRRRKEKPDLVF
jgi:hypothetical protein